MDTINVYTAEELQENYPQAFEKAYKNYVDDCAGDSSFWQDEIMDSLKACYKQADITLNNWSISDSSPSWVKITIPTFWSELAQDDLLVNDYFGKLALKWVKDVYDIKTVKRVNFTYENEKGKKVKSRRWDITKKNGTSWDCGFTGYCADYDFLYSLLDDIKDGCTLFESYNNLADVAGKLFQQEYEHETSEEYFLEMSDINDWKYTEEGVQV